MKYQLRMLVEVDESKVDGFFKLEDWMLSLPIEKGDLLDYGIAETKHDKLNKDGSWEQLITVKPCDRWLASINETENEMKKEHAQELAAKIQTASEAQLEEVNNYYYYYSMHLGEGCSEVQAHEMAVSDMDGEE